MWRVDFVGDQTVPVPLAEGRLEWVGAPSQRVLNRMDDSVRFAGELFFTGDHDLSGRLGYVFWRDTPVAAFVVGASRFSDDVTRCEVIDVVHLLRGQQLTTDFVTGSAEGVFDSIARLWASDILPLRWAGPTSGGQLVGGLSFAAGDSFLHVANTILAAGGISPLRWAGGASVAPPVDGEELRGALGPIGELVEEWGSLGAVNRVTVVSEYSGVDPVTVINREDFGRRGFFVDGFVPRFPSAFTATLTREASLRLNLDGPQRRASFRMDFDPRMMPGTVWEWRGGRFLDVVSVSASMGAGDCRVVGVVR